MGNADVGLLDASEDAAPPSGQPQPLAPGALDPNENAAPAPGLASAPVAPKADPIKPVYRSDNPMTAALSFFRDPDRLKLAAMAAAEAQRPDLLEWIKRGHEAQQENGIDAIGALAVGDKAKAMQLFNAAGGEGVDSIEEGPTKGTYTVVNRDGVRRDIDPKKELYRFLTPPQKYAAAHNEELLDLKRENATQLWQLRKEAQAAKDANNEALYNIRMKQIELAERGEDRKAQRDATEAMLTVARTGLAQAQAGLANTRAGNVGSDKPLGLKDFNKGVDKKAKEIFTALDPNTGKNAYDAEDALLVTSAAKKARADGVDPDDAVLETKEQFDAAKAAATSEVTAKVAEAQKNSGFFKGNEVKKLTGGKSVEEYTQEEIKKRTRDKFKAGLSSVAPAANTPTPGAGDGTAQDATPRGAGSAQTATGAAANVAPATGKGPVGVPGSTPQQAKAPKYKEGDHLEKTIDGKRRWYTVVNGMPKLDAVQPKEK